MDWEATGIMIISIICGIIVGALAQSVLFGIIVAIAIGGILSLLFEIKDSNEIKKAKEQRYRNIRTIAEAERLNSRNSPVSSGILIHRGSSYIGEVLYFIEGNNVHRGNSIVGEVIYYIDGNNVHKGIGTAGEIVYYINGNMIHRGFSTVGEVVFCIEGNNIHRGFSSVGEIVYCIERCY